MIELNHKMSMYSVISYIEPILPKGLRKELNDLRYLRRSRIDYNPEQYKTPVFQSSFLPFYYYRCIFVHIPKNAGLSVSYTLFGNTGGSHRKIKHYKAKFAKTTFRKFFKFTFVRNPWDRVVSTYFFLKEGGITEKDAKWSEENLSRFENFEEFVREWLNNENANSSLHFQEQHLFLSDEEGNFPLDFIGRFENLEEDFKKVCSRLGIERDLDNKNSSNRKRDYKSYYSAETRAIVAKVYEKDIQMFNYAFD